MRPLLLLLLAGCTPSEGGPGATCMLERPALSDWHLKAEGTRFVDALGRTVFLRGVNVGGRSKFAPFAPFEFTDYGAALDSYMDRAASWGITAARVPFVWEAMEPQMGQYDEQFLARYDQLLDAAWKRGIYTVVDFHQ